MLKHLTAVVALIATTAVVSSCGGPAAGPLVITLESASRVVVTGLSGDEAAALARSRPDAASWSTVVRVSVLGQPAPIAGSYTVDHGTVVFRPAFPLEPGRRYEATVDLAGTPVQRTPAIVRVDLALPANDLTPTTRVISVEPLADTWPANTLRAYVYFSAPMDGTSGVSHITLRDRDGSVVDHAFLTVEAEFWNAERTRYTVFFDPGRVKQGIRPNRELGRPLVPGRTYTLEIDAAWHDAVGRPLVETYQRRVEVSAPVERAIALSEWSLRVPAAGTLDAMTVTFPWGMDRPLIERTVSVAGPSGTVVDGRGELDATGLVWTFVPTRPWSAGAHQLRAQPVLEDPSGNQIGKAFEVSMNAPAPVIPASAYLRAFVIR